MNQNVIVKFIQNIIGNDLYHIALNAKIPKIAIENKLEFKTVIENTPHNASIKKMEGIKMRIERSISTQTFMIRKLIICRMLRIFFHSLDAFCCYSLHAFGR